MLLKNNSVKSYAKINLGLKIIELLPDGYHSITTIMQEVNLYDIIQITRHKDIRLRIHCNGAIKVPSNDTNLCIKAAQLIYNHYNIKEGINIYLTKNIATGSGLGGGSSNAANILCMLNNIFKLNISDNELHKLAFKIGCDTPFFINGGIQLCEGKGEKLTQLSMNLKGYTILLVLPNFSVSTKWAYSFFKNDLSKRKDSAKFRTFPAHIDWKFFENDFEKIINLTYPEVKNIRETLKSKGALFVSLSGSGSTMFGIFDNLSIAELASLALKPYHCHIVKPIYRT